MHTRGFIAAVMVLLCACQRTSPVRDAEAWVDSWLQPPYDTYRIDWRRWSFWARDTDDHTSFFEAVQTDTFPVIHVETAHLGIAIGKPQPESRIALDWVPAPLSRATMALYTDGDDEAIGCVRAILRHGWHIYPPRPHNGERSGVGVSECPPGIATRYVESAGADTIETCAVVRPADLVADPLAAGIGMISIVHRSGRVSSVALDALGPRTQPSRASPACWPWVRDPDAVIMARHQDEIELTWDDDGNLAVITMLRDGIRAGPMAIYRRDGTPAFVGSFEDDVPHGLWAWISPELEIVWAKLYVYGVEAGDIPWTTRGGAFGSGSSGP